MRMPWRKEAPQPQPAPEAEAEQQDPGKDIDQMLNDKKFVDFLTKYKDRIENAEQIRERYERFQQVGGVIKEVQGILADEFSRELSTGETKISINPTEIEGARDYIEDLAVNNESEFDNVLNTIREYHRTNEEAARTQQEINQRFKELEQKEKTLGEVRQMNGFKRWIRLGMNDREKQAIREAKGFKLDIRHPQNSELALDTERNNAEIQISAELKPKMEAFNEVRVELMTLLGEKTGALQLAKDKLTKKFTSSMGTSLKDVDRAAQMYADYSAGEDEGKFTFDYLEGVEGFNREEYVKQLNDEAEARVTAEIKNAIEVSPLVHGQQFSKLETAIEKYSKRERLGTKDQEQSKDFVLGVVHEMYSRYANAYQEPQKRSKSFLLQRILIKNNVNPREDFAKAKMEEEARQAEEAEAAKVKTEAAGSNPSTDTDAEKPAPSRGEGPSTYSEDVAPELEDMDKNDPSSAPRQSSETGGGPSTGEEDSWTA